MYGLISWVVKKVYEWGKDLFVGPDPEPAPIIENQKDTNEPNKI